MSSEGVGSRVVSIASTQALLAGAFATGITLFVSEAEASAAGLGAIALSVGAPTVVGALIANVVMPVKNWDVSLDVKRGIAAGAAGVGFLMATGQLPVQLDVQLLGTVGLIGVSTVLGDILGVYIKK